MMKAASSSWTKTRILKKTKTAEEPSATIEPSTTTTVEVDQNE
ncbi:hypothetical protein LIDJA_04080 [Leptospira interrogans]